ncbi:MAG: molecular chaperone [Pseudomonadota bacterium]
MFRPLKTLLVTSLVTLSAPFSAAELMIAPTRIVLENGERSSELVLVNKAAEQGAYRISLENRRMLTNGSLETVDEARDGERFADDILRFSPRRALLEPGGRQTIRVSAQTAGLEPGEYRSHLRVMGAPTSAGRTLSEATSEGGDAISIELIAVRSLTIPAIIRVGDLDASVEIQSASTAPSDEVGETLFIARLTRTGDRSTYGDIELYVEDQAEPVYFARGIAIYTPNTERDVILPMPDEIAERLKGQTVRIAYVSSDPLRPGTISDSSMILN